MDGLGSGIRPLVAGRDGQGSCGWIWGKWWGIVGKEKRRGGVGLRAELKWGGGRDT